MSCKKSSTSSSSSSTPAKSRDEMESSVTRKAHDTFCDCFNEVANENNNRRHDQEKKAIARDWLLSEDNLDRS